MRNYKVGIVTVTYNSGRVLPEFLTSVWAQTHTECVVYAVDNDSNIGVAEGNNIGIRMALADGCDGVLLLNNDVVFPADMVETLITSNEQNHSDMVAPKILYHEPSNKIWWAGGHFQPLLGYRAVHHGLDQEDHGQFDRAARVTYTPTCCVLIERRVFAEIGLMDAKYFVYSDDTDFMLRAYRAGFILLYEPAAVLYHKVSSLSGGSSSPFVVHLAARNRVYYWAKHMGRSLAVVYTAALSMIYLAKCLIGIKTRNTLRIQLKAMRDAFNMS